MMQRWTGPKGIVSDILPAAPELVASGKVVFEPGMEMSLVGFDLLLTTTETVVLPGTGTTLEIAGLPALAILKMVAWLDRPDRIKDLGDLARILSSCLVADDDRRFDPSSPLFQVEYSEQSAFFVGTEIRQRGSAHHVDIAQRFLTQLRRLDRAGFQQMLRESALVGDDAEERLSALLESFERAISQ